MLGLILIMEMSFSINTVHPYLTEDFTERFEQTVQGLIEGAVMANMCNVWGEVLGSPVHKLLSN